VVPKDAVVTRAEAGLGNDTSLVSVLAERYTRLQLFHGPPRKGAQNVAHTRFNYIPFRSPRG
jgi:hypothetical protein